MLARAHSWLDHHPAAGDTALAAVLLAFSLSTLLGEQFDAGLANVALTAVLTVPLAVRRRAPVAVFACVMLGCGAELWLADDFLAANVGALVALYTLIAYASRRLAATGFAVALAGTVPFALHVDDRVDSGALVTWLVVTVHILLASALGDRMHARLRERSSLREQTRLLAAERDQQATIAAAAERTRIARELHDVVAHSLSVVIAQADGGRYAAERDPGAAADALHTIARTAREAQAEMRRALGVLGERPDEPLRPQPGVDDLSELVARTREAGLDVALRHDGSPRELAPAVGLAVYRVVQEALTNVLKHAGRDATAHVLLGWEPERVTVLVRDDGGGATAGDGSGRDGASTARHHGADRRAAAGDGSGRGLAGMRERVQARGGTFSAGRAGSGGFEVRAAIPTADAPARLRTRA